MNFGPTSGAFLPVLKPNTHSAGIKKTAKRYRYRSATTRSLDSTTRSGGGKILTTNTASLIDLSGIASPPGENKGVLRLYRENSMPANFKIVPQPVLKYSYDRGVEKVLSKLDLLDGAAETTDRLTSRAILQSEDIKKMALQPSPPSAAKSQQSTSKSVETTRKTESINNDTPSGSAAVPNGDLETETKWKLSVLIPDDNPTNDDLKEMLPDEIDTIKVVNNPKSILKPLGYADQFIEPPSKRSLGVATYVLATPMPPVSRLPPTTRPPNVTMAPSKRRINRKKSAELHKIANQNRAENSPENLSDESSISHELDCDSAPLDSGSGEQSVELTKSVRFAQQPANIKEYYPWEAPKHSLVHHENKPPSPPPIPTKTSPIFRP